MTQDSMALADLLQKAGDGAFLRMVAETVSYAGNWVTSRSGGVL
ncbi:hypothetical protein [Azospirillum doebereinerae]